MVLLLTGLVFGCGPLRGCEGDFIIDEFSADAPTEDVAAALLSPNRVDQAMCVELCQEAHFRGADPVHVLQVDSCSIDDASSVSDTATTSVSMTCTGRARVHEACK